MSDSTRPFRAERGPRNSPAAVAETEQLRDNQAFTGATARLTAALDDLKERQLRETRYADCLVRGGPGDGPTPWQPAPYLDLDAAKEKARMYGMNLASHNPAHQPWQQKADDFQGLKRFLEGGDRDFYDITQGRRSPVSEPQFKPTDRDIVLQMIQDVHPVMREYIKKKPVAIDVNWEKSTWQQIAPWWWDERTEIETKGGQITSIKVRGNLETNVRAALIHLALYHDPGFKLFDKGRPPSIGAIPPESVRERQLREQYLLQQEGSLRQLRALNRALAYKYNVTEHRTTVGIGMDFGVDVLGPGEITGNPLGSAQDYLLAFGAYGVAPRSYSAPRMAPPAAWGARIEPVPSYIPRLRPAGEPSPWLFDSKLPLGRYDPPPRMVFPITTRPAVRSDIPGYPGMTIPKGTMIGNRSGLGAAESWGRPETLAEHFKNHGADFGAKSAEEYAQLASRFLQEGQAARLPTKIDTKGVIRVYDPKTNTFGSFNPDGTTRTFYKLQPKSPANPRGHTEPTNEAYWNKQPGVPPWMPSSN